MTEQSSPNHLKINIVQGSSNSGSGSVSPRAASPIPTPSGNIKAPISNVSTSATKNAYDVIIVGAGIAGITAAHEISTSLGLDVLLLEASERIGGRLLTFNINKNSIDMGGAWVHPAQKHVMDTIHQLGLKTTTQYEEGISLLACNGESTASSTNHLKIASDKFAADSLTPAEKEFYDAVIVRPWDQIYQEGPRKWAHMDGITVSSFFDGVQALESESDAGTDRINKVRALFDAEFRSMYSCEPSQVSVCHLMEETLASNGFLNYFNTGGMYEPGGKSEMRIVGGAQQLCTKLLAACNTATMTLLKGAPVLNIKAVSAAASAGSPISGSYNYNVYSTQQRKWACKYLVLAIPPTQITRISIENGLIPANKMHLFSSMFMGQCIKQVRMKW